MCSSFEGVSFFFLDEIVGRANDGSAACGEVKIGCWAMRGRGGVVMSQRVKMRRQKTAHAEHSRESHVGYAPLRARFAPLSAVEAALLALSTRVECVLPYAEAALLAEVHKTGTIETEEYVDDGTRLVAYVPDSLRNRLSRACAAAGSCFEDDAPERDAVAAANDGAKRKRGRSM